MTAIELERTKKWVENWKTLGPELERMREEDIRNSDTRRDFPSFARLLTKYLAENSPPDTSGLVEQQYWFAKLHHE